MAQEVQTCRSLPADDALATTGTQSHAMYPIEIRQFNVSIESSFLKAVSFTKANFDALGEALLGAFDLQGLAAESLYLRRGNELFDYELTFSLFRGNASFSLNSKRTRVDFSNGRIAADLTTITDVLTRYYKCLQVSAEFVHTLSTLAHFDFASEQAFTEFFSTRGTRWEHDFPRTGITTYLSHPGWDEQTRVMLEPSLMFPNGGFTNMTAYCHSTPVTAELIARTVELFNDLAKQCHLLPKPLP